MTQWDEMSRIRQKHNTHTVHAQPPSVHTYTSIVALHANGQFYLHASIFIHLCGCIHGHDRMLSHRAATRVGLCVYVDMCLV